MNFVIFDLEATCWNGHRPSEIQEIIEIGAVMVDNFGEVEKEFKQFVKPFVHPSLSYYCKELTGIRQEEINRARMFPEVLEDFKTWVGVQEDDYVLCSWGKFDKSMLLNDCHLHKLETNWLEHHINLKAQYKDIKKLKKKIGLKWAMDKEDLEFTGREHRAYDDAYNTAKIFVRYLDDWSY